MKRNVKYLIMDVDGTLTDGKLYIGNEGEFCKAFNIKDGCGIHDILIPSDIVPVILTGRKSKIVELRSKELCITDIYQGVSDKMRKLNELLGIWKCHHENIAYIGDDINDLPCMEVIKARGGVIGCPANSAIKVVQIADFVSKNNGGEGAVRDFIEWLL